MRRLLPPDDATPVDLDDVYGSPARPVPDGRPWVLANMVSTVDGGTALAGVSGPLGGPADRQVFGAVRAVPDVILVGAGTVRAERYGPPRLTDERRERRSRTGQAPVPRLAIVTGRGELDLSTPLFTEAEAPPFVVTTEAAGADAVTRASAVAEVVVAGEARVSVPDALAELRRRGAEVVLCEGGPTLLGQLVVADALDELCLTLAPLAVAGASSRITGGAVADAPLPLHLVSVLEEDGMLFLRYVRAA